MKKVIMLLVVGMLSFNAHAVIKCERDSRGNQCCWDTDRDGVFKPLSCY